MTDSEEEERVNNDLFSLNKEPSPGIESNFMKLLNAFLLWPKWRIGVRRMGEPLWLEMLSLLR